MILKDFLDTSPEDIEIIVKRKEGKDSPLSKPHLYDVEKWEVEIKDNKPLVVVYVK